ncbi:MAG: DNA-binding transcriptional regulator [Verrucomicrobiota bacterium JB024]|nr:DNA-binding transcriptional regulator [Verrucomicrobiota bacterium JB024]
MNPPRRHILLALGWYSSAIHRGIARYAREANWVLDTGMTRDGRLPALWQGDGVISLLHTGADLYEFVRTCGRPVVNIGDCTLPDVPNVRCDDDAIGRMAADHFTERGFRHGAFFLRSDVPSAIRRMEAFRRNLEKSGGTFHLIDWVSRCRADPGLSESGLLAWLGQELLKLPRPLAVFSEHDEVSIEVLQACQTSEIPVPEQVAVLGVDDDPLRCEFAPVPLSSIDNNQEMEGYRAAQTLERMLGGWRAGQRDLLVPPLGVTTRLSTDILAVRHPHVAAALHHIWQNYTRPINAKTVAATVPITYQALHAAFKKELRRTIAEEITLKRLEKAQQLLAETNLRAHEVAEACGFPSEDRMGRVFKRILNQTPLEYRRENALRS